MTTPVQPARPRGVPPRVSDPARQLTFQDPQWTYPSTCGAGNGTCGIRVFVTDDEQGVLVVLEEKGIGATITNSTETLIPFVLFLLDMPAERVTVLEWWPDSQAGYREGHLDLAELVGQTPHYMAVWPVAGSNPRYVELRDWFEKTGTLLCPDLPLP